jgi:hypothetical protein
MCSAYWTLKDVPFTCPSCGVASTIELQTHFMGEPGSCVNYYSLGEPVEELQDIEAVTLGDEGPDDFIGDCPKCHAWFDFGGRIVKGAVVSAWPIVRDIGAVEVGTSE